MITSATSSSRRTQTRSMDTLLGERTALFGRERVAEPAVDLRLAERERVAAIERGAQHGPQIAGGFPACGRTEAADVGEILGLRHEKHGRAQTANHHQDDE